MMRKENLLNARELDKKLDAMTPDERSQFFRQTTGWLRRRSKEWKAAWRNLIAITGDTDFVAEYRNNCWGYMGSDSWSGFWAHYFRHPLHPKTKSQMRLRVPASPGWSPQLEGGPDNQAHQPQKKPKKKKKTLH